MAGRLFQGLKQRIEGGVGDLVGLVENVNLEAVAGRTIARGFAQLANLVDATVGGRVDLDHVHVHRVAGADFDARIADAARLGHRMVLRLAIQRHRQNTRDGRLANAAVAAKDVAVGDASLRDGILQRAGDVFLPDHLGELLWTVFARQNLITHGRGKPDYTVWRCGTGMAPAHSPASGLTLPGLPSRADGCGRRPPSRV